MEVGAKVWYLLSPTTGPGCPTRSRHSGFEVGSEGVSTVANAPDWVEAVVTEKGEGYLVVMVESTGEEHRVRVPPCSSPIDSAPAGATNQHHHEQQNKHGHKDAAEIEEVKLRNDDDDFGIGIDRIHGLHSASSSPRGGGVGMHNLELLPHLHEPAILHCLQQRYEEGEIYTYTGPILIAINPFKPMPLMYAPSVLQAFLHQGRLRGAEEGENRPRLPPHVFGIANAAYRNMVAALFNAASSPQSDEDLPLDGRQIWSDMHRNPNQFVLISGESGAGKTESTKFLLRYLTAAGSMGGSDLARDSVMDRIVQSNPVLEAFGNAATLRNHNSSRFGKFIQLHFDGRGRLVSGKVETYLLEKVRLCVHQAGHRNFHVFYQMAAGASPAQRAEWAMLGDIQDFFYATSNNSGGAGVGVKLRLIDDAEEFRLLLHAMAALGIQHTEREELFRATAGILHLGQLAFVPDNDGAADGGGGCGGALNLTAGGREDGSTLRGECIDSIMQASRLLGVHSDELIKCLTTRNILAASESFEKKLTPQQAIDARDALARHLYSRIFSWLVAAINCGISGEAPSKSSSRQHGAVIGVLDIFGFESFHLNSFEQLCINYTNESLQQQFNRHVFKLEEEEYLREGIDPLLVVFSDNQDCLDLIEHRALGILAALDDEGRMPGGSDRNFAARLYKAYGTHARFYATAKHVRSNEFVIKHYAGDVCYNAHLFVDKNRDELPKECSYLLSSASNSLIKAIFSDHCANTKQATNKGGNTTGNKSAVSVGLQFRGQLHDLLAHIAQTVPHYIRCIKPNDSCSGDRFDRIRCVEQLRHCGVLEAVRVARAGFPVRLGHRDFFCRYRPLANPHAPMTAELPRRLYRDESNPKEMCRLLLRAIMDDTFPCVDSSSEERSGDGVHSRLFSYQFWRGTQRIGESAVQLGATKVFLRRLAYDVLEGMVTRRLERAALKVQSVLRATKLRVLYRAMRRSALQIQSVFRGYRSRKHTQQVRCHRAASKIQSSFRRFSALFRYATLRRSALKIQGTVRMFVILRRFRSLRAAIVVLQSACRRRMALYSLKRLHQKAGGEGVLPEDTSENSSTAKISLIRHQVFVEESEGQHAAQLARIAKGLVGVVTGTPTRAASVATASDNAAGVRSSRAAGDDAGIEASFTERLVLVRELAELRARFEEQMSARLIAEQRIASIISEAEVEKTQLLTRIDVLMKHIESLSAALVASRSAFISESPSSALTARIDEERQQRVRLEAQVAALEAAFRDRSSPAASASHHREAFTSSASSSVPAKKSPVRGAAKTVPHPSPSRKVISSANASPSAVSRRHIQQEPVPASPPSSKVEAFVKLLREGIPVSLCDLKRNLRHRAILRCDVDCVELVFYYRTTSVARTPSKMNVPPINVFDVVDCVPGALSESDQRSEGEGDRKSTSVFGSGGNSSSSSASFALASAWSQCLLTVVTQPPPAPSGRGERNLRTVLLLDSRDQRNQLLANIRRLVAHTRGSVDPSALALQRAQRAISASMDSRFVAASPTTALSTSTVTTTTSTTNYKAVRVPRVQHSTSPSREVPSLTPRAAPSSSSGSHSRDAVRRQLLISPTVSANASASPSRALPSHPSSPASSIHSVSPHHTTTSNTTTTPTNISIPSSSCCISQGGGFGRPSGIPLLLARRPPRPSSSSSVSSISTAAAVTPPLPTASTPYGSKSPADCNDAYPHDDVYVGGSGGSDDSDDGDMMTATGDEERIPTCVYTGAPPTAGTPSSCCN